MNIRILEFFKFILVFLSFNYLPTLSFAADPDAFWSVSRPESLNMDSKLLEQAGEEMRKNVPNALSLLVIRHGHILKENYFNDADANRATEAYSLTKIVTGSLIGILLKNNLIESVDERIIPYLPSTFKRGASKAENITLRNLMTMTSGFKWEPDQFSLLYPRLCGINSIFEEPLAHSPGAIFNYDDANAHVLSYMIENISGQEMSEFAKSTLFKYLGISNFNWLKSPDGKAFGGFGLSLTTRDIAKIGFLYLMGGQWKEEQVLRRSFVLDATRPQNSGGFPGNTPYGFFWWNTQEDGVDIFYGLGLGGQLLIVAPQLSLITVIRVQSPSFASDINGTKYLFSKFILPAILDRPI